MNLKCSVITHLRGHGVFAMSRIFGNHRCRKKAHLNDNTSRILNPHHLAEKSGNI